MAVSGSDPVCLDPESVLDLKAVLSLSLCSSLVSILHHWVHWNTLFFNIKNICLLSYTIFTRTLVSSERFKFFQSVGCWRLLAETLPRKYPRPKGTPLPRIKPSPGGGEGWQLVRRAWSVSRGKTQRPSPLASIWNNSEGPVQFQSSLRDWLGSLLQLFTA